MRAWRFFLTAALVVSAIGCTSQPAFQDPFTRPQIDWEPSLKLEIGGAERILGNQSRLEKTTSYVSDGTRTYQSAFRDDWIDPETGKTGILYYMYEEYSNAVGARAYLYSTLKANRLDPGDAVLLENGAEIHYLAGDKLVRMAMILKDNHLVRLKVNQLTSRYSLDEFQRVTREMAKQL